MIKLWRRPAIPTQRWFSAAVLVMAMVVSALLWWRHPVDLGIPTCPSLTVTGLYCPGCGTLRAGHHLLHFHWLDALRHNPLTVAFTPLIALWLLAHVDTLVRGRRWGVDLAPWLGWALVIAVLGFWGLRNVPFEIFSLLRPPGAH